MSSQRTANIFLVIILIAIVIAIGYFMLIKKTSDTTTNIDATKIEYVNNQYGFNMFLPLSWKGYSIVESSWEGNRIDTLNQSDRGPEILIRHPLWSPLNPRQDIPIMIFTPDEWELIGQEKLSLGAAPIGPSELGRNANYIFALPARYNYAFLTGFEEVEQIIANKSFHAF